MGKAKRAARQRKVGKGEETTGDHVPRSEDAAASGPDGGSGAESGADVSPSTERRDEGGGVGAEGGAGEGSGAAGEEDTGPLKTHEDVVEIPRQESIALEMTQSMTPPRGWQFRQYEVETLEKEIKAMVDELDAAKAEWRSDLRKPTVKGTALENFYYNFEPTAEAREVLVSAEKQLAEFAKEEEGESAYPPPPSRSAYLVRVWGVAVLCIIALGALWAIFTGYLASSPSLSPAMRNFIRILIPRSIAPGDAQTAILAIAANAVWAVPLLQALATIAGQSMSNLFRDKGAMSVSLPASVRTAGAIQGAVVAILSLAPIGLRVFSEPPLSKGGQIMAWTGAVLSFGLQVYAVGCRTSGDLASWHEAVAHVAQQNPEDKSASAHGSQWLASAHTIRRRLGCIGRPLANALGFALFQTIVQSTSLVAFLSTGSDSPLLHNILQLLATSAGPLLQSA